MPALTPAEVQIFPSWTKIGSGSTRTSGKRVLNVSAAAQCVVARRPDSNPASASRKAPTQIDTTRPRRLLPYPSDHFRRMGRVVVPRTGYQNRVDLGQIECAQRFRKQLCVGAGRDRAAAERGDLDLVPGDACRRGEHIRSSENVEHGKVQENDTIEDRDN